MNTSSRAAEARIALNTIGLEFPEYDLPQQIVQMLADLRLLCDRDGLDFEFLSEQSEVHAASYQEA